MYLEKNITEVLELATLSKMSTIYNIARDNSFFVNYKVQIPGTKLRRISY